jgi:site-specific recombinase XerC
LFPFDEANTLATYPLGRGKLVNHRDQAAAAMLYLSGIRASAFVSLPIDAVDLKNMEVKQWPSLGVRTKNRNTALAKRIRKLSKLVAIVYKSPHKFRPGHAVYALLHAKTMADYKAISQNLMHGNIKVTDSIYAWLNDNEVKKRIAGLSKTNRPAIPDSQFINYLRNLSKTELKQTVIHCAHLLAD